MKNFARIWVKLTMLLFDRTYPTNPISLGNFGLRLARAPTPPQNIFFSRFFLKSSQDLRLRWQYFCGFLPFFNFAPHEFFFQNCPNLPNFTLYESLSCSLLLSNNSPTLNFANCAFKSSRLHYCVLN